LAGLSYTSGQSPERPFFLTIWAPLRHGPLSEGLLSFGDFMLQLGPFFWRRISSCLSPWGRRLTTFFFRPGPLPPLFSPCDLDGFPWSVPVLEGWALLSTRVPPVPPPFFYVSPSDRHFCRPQPSLSCRFVGLANFGFAVGTGEFLPTTRPHMQPLPLGTPPSFHARLPPPSPFCGRGSSVANHYRPPEPSSLVFMGNNRGNTASPVLPSYNRGPPPGGAVLS